MSKSLAVEASSYRCVYLVHDHAGRGALRHVPIEHVWLAHGAPGPRAEPGIFLKLLAILVPVNHTNTAKYNSILNLQIVHIAHLYVCYLDPIEENSWWTTKF